MYYLTCAEWTSRTGYPVYDTYVAAAENIYGPYECRHLMVAHGGESTVFSAEGDQWYAVRFDPVAGFLSAYPRPTSILSHMCGAREFRDDKGRWWHIFFGNDSTAPWFERMGIIPLRVRQEGRQFLVDIADDWPKDPTTGEIK